MHSNFRAYLLEIAKATNATKRETIQSLWSGYGSIDRIEMENAAIETVVVKSIRLQPATQHPRGWNTDFAHNRKVKSYQVETHWYQHWAQDCTPNCRVPKLMGSYSEGDQQWIVMEDLNAQFPLRKNSVTLEEVKACISWLAHFHARFLGHKPDGLWETGTYWHLATRPDELEKITDPELKAKASLIDAALNGCRYQTIVHGDAKLANFCFSEDGTKVAAVDFQYVGGGCGMKDLTYFLGSCLPGDACELYEEELLDYYFSVLREAVAAKAPDICIEALEEEWRGMYAMAYADFMRFLFGWMPTHQKINAYSVMMLQKVLKSLSDN